MSKFYRAVVITARVMFIVLLTVMVGIAGFFVVEALT